MQPSFPPNEAVTLRSALYDGDIDTIVHMHGEIYSRECGFDPSFEEYVSIPLRHFAKAPTDRERIWVAERNGKIIGCIAIAASSATEAQLRWYLVVPEARGSGLGRRLLKEAITFCRRRKYKSIFLWTVSALTVAAQIYTKVGFVLVESVPSNKWGVDVVEEKYVLEMS